MPRHLISHSVGDGNVGYLVLILFISLPIWLLAYLEQRREEKRLNAGEITPEQTYRAWKESRGKRYSRVRGYTGLIIGGVIFFLLLMIGATA